MRILHVLSERGFSGGENQLLHLLDHLATRGHESILVLNPNASFLPVAEKLGLEVAPVPMRNDLDLPASWRLRRLIEARHPNLVHLACSRSHKLGAHALVGLGGRPPIVVTRRMDYPLGRTIYRRWLYGRAVDAIIAVSEGVCAEVLKTGVDPAHVHVIRDGVDVEGLAVWSEPTRREAARRQLGLADGTLCGVTSASLNRRKGQDVLIRALAEVELPPGRNHLVWLFAGEGPARAALEGQASGLPPGMDVRFLGQVDQIGPVLAAADVFVLPSRKEGLGVALLEAMAVGVPVVGSAVGGIREAVVSEETGLLVQPADAAGLGRALSRLLADAELARKLSGAARRRVARHFSVRRMCEESEQLYRSLASQ